MIQNYFDNVKRILGSLISNARAREGWGKGIYLFSFLKIIGSPAKRAMRAGKKKKGCGENEFLPARPVWEWESVSVIPASAGRQNRKIFVSLIEKNLWGTQLKNDEKIFLFCSPRGKRKRWAGLLPVRAEIVARKRFELRPVIATRRNLMDFARSLFARSPRLRRVSLRKNPFVWRLNQTAGEARRGLVWPAGGGSELRSNSQMKFVSNFFLSAFGGIRSQFLIPRFTAKGD